MSFASEVKKELLGIKEEDEKQVKSLVFGILQSCSDMVISNRGTKIVVKSYILPAIQKVMQLVKKYYDVDTEIEYGTDQNLNKKRYYYLIISKNVLPFIEDFSLMPFAIIDSSPLLQSDEQKATFIRGLFIARGSINDPRKNGYHLEITCKNQELASFACATFNHNAIEAKTIQRKNNFVVYIKKSESISAALAYMGAASGVFYFEDSRIVRDISNMANRMANCDIANVKKSTDCASKQLKAIQYIRKMGYFNKMPLRLQTMALMREEYPTSTLDELSEFSDNYFGKPLSKSGISHCLRSLTAYYLEIYTKNKQSENKSENKKS